MGQTEDKLVQNFLYGRHRGDDIVDFPDSTLYIGSGFEIGGTYEDWGFGVFKKTESGLRTIAEGRNMTDAIIRARKILSCKHDWADNGWCKLCSTHKTLFGL